MYIVIFSNTLILDLVYDKKKQLMAIQVGKVPPWSCVYSYVMVILFNFQCLYMKRNAFVCEKICIEIWIAWYTTSNGPMKVEDLEHSFNKM